jgi:hypothetical protein
MAYVVEHANLDEQPVIIAGTYLTVSAVRSWLIHQDDGDAVTVELGRIDPQQNIGLAIGERIRVEAIMKTETTRVATPKPRTRQSFGRVNPRDYCTTAPAGTFGHRSAATGRRPSARRFSQ